ncbi:MAG: thermonuclease family protein [Nitrospinae bacterium]|nr:thermonuclease family protein [Nitrospinota bacterium]MBF0634446.1 thermonuclease family protein [Nitrospinota bacterium]
MRKLACRGFQSFQYLRLVFALACIGWVFQPVFAFSQPEDTQNLILGKVFKLYDGDTIAIKDDLGKEVRVQIAYIDAPDMDEKTFDKQPLYTESIKLLSGLILNKEVIIESFGKDKNGRVEGMVFLDKMNINVEMVRRGMAEIYEPVRSNPSAFNKDYVQLLFDAENLAKSEKKGIWGHPDYISPFQFRRRAGQ